MANLNDILRPMTPSQERAANERFRRLYGACPRPGAIGHTDWIHRRQGFMAGCEFGLARQMIWPAAMDLRVAMATRAEGLYLGVIPRVSDRIMGIPLCSDGKNLWSMKKDMVLRPDGWIEPVEFLGPLCSE